MVYLKSEDEIEIIRQGADILGRVHGELAKEINPGVALKKLDAIAEAYIRDHGGVPSFKGYSGFPASICASVNEELLHGIPGDRTLKDGDILSLDCGVYYKNFHSDQAFTYSVGNIQKEFVNLLQITRESLERGAEVAKAGNRVGDISYEVQTFVESNGYSVVRAFGGHGVGKSLHEEPYIPNFGKRGTRMKLQAGMVLAIEPLVNIGKREVVQADDGWTIKSMDGSYTAHFEHTVVVRAQKVERLTTFDYIDEVLKKKYE